MLEYRHLTYTYPGRETPALTDVSFDVRPGDLVAVVGRSGAGKSSLLWGANGLIPHFYGGRFGGDVIVCGKSTRRTSPQDLAAHVGTVFQEPARRFVSQSVLDEIAFGLEIAGEAPERLRSRVDDVVDRLDLGMLVHRPLDQMSGGEQQRVALAAALARDPEILLLDEPTSQLDRRGSAALFAWLADRQNTNEGAVLVAEHRLQPLASVATQAVYLDGQGGLAAAGSPRDVWKRMPFGDPIAAAMRRFGMDEASADAGVQLRRRLAEMIPPSRNGRQVSHAESVLIGRGLGAAYHRIPALRGVDLTLVKGTVTAVLGENGSGKTTLLRALVGLIPLEAGEVMFRGNRIDHRPVSELAGAIGYVPQWPSALLFADTVRDELVFTMAQHPGLDREPTAVDDLLARLSLDDVAERYPRDLSSGQRQRAALAAVLIAQPTVLLLDEPTLGMDPIARRQLTELLRGLASDGAAVAVATHDVEFAAGVSDDTVVLEAGRVRDFGPTPATLFKRPETQTALQQLTGQPWPANVETIEDD